MEVCCVLTDRNEVDQDRIGTREWYDFVGNLADVLPSLHLGGEKATRDLLEMCQLGPKSQVLDII